MSAQYGLMRVEGELGASGGANGAHSGDAIRKALVKAENPYIEPNGKYANRIAIREYDGYNMSVQRGHAL